MWEALILADGPHAVRLDTPLGSLSCDAFGFGAIRVEPSADGQVSATVRTAAPHAPLRVPDGVRLIYEPAE